MLDADKYIDWFFEGYDLFYSPFEYLTVVMPDGGFDWPDRIKNINSFSYFLFYFLEYLNKGKSENNKISKKEAKDLINSIKRYGNSSTPYDESIILKNHHIIEALYNEYLYRISGSKDERESIEELLSINHSSADIKKSNRL